MNNPKTSNYRECSECHFPILTQARLFEGKELCQDCYDGKMVKREIELEDNTVKKWKIKDHKQYVKIQS